MDRTRVLTAAHRRAVIAVAACSVLGVTALSPGTALAKLPPPTVSEYAASSNTVEGSGGTVTLSATVTNATECVFSSNKVLAGLPASVPCTGGLIEETVTFPANTGTKSLIFKLSLVAKGSGPVKVTLSVTQPPEAHCVPGPGANLVNCSLVAANLEGADLEGADLEGAKLSRAIVTNANFSGANLTGVSSGSLVGTPAMLPPEWGLRHGYLVGPGANLYRAAFHKQNLNGVDLEGADLEQADLAAAFMEKTNLRHAELNYAELELVDAREAQLQGAQMAIGNGGLDANFDGANFEGAELTRADFEDAKLIGANLTSTNLERALFARATLTSADLEGAILTHVNMSLAALEHTNLTGAEASAADLESAELGHSNLEATDLEAAKLTNVSSGEILNHPALLPVGWKLVDGYLIGPGARLVRSELAGAELQFADLAGADIEQSNLERVNFDGATLQNAHLNQSDLFEAQMEETNITGVEWGSSICPDGTMSTSDGGTCEGHT